MGNTQELRFQGLCLENDEGYKYMDNYDDLHELVRDRLKSSNYNLCAACVVSQTHYRVQMRQPVVPDYLKTIRDMEQELKRQEPVEAG